MRSIPTSQQNQIRRNRELAVRQAEFDRLQDEVRIANEIVRSTGCTRSEALKVAARFIHHHG